MDKSKKLWKKNLVLQIYLTKLNIIPQNSSKNEMRNTKVWKLSTLYNFYWKYFSSRNSNEFKQAAIFRDGFGVNQRDKVLRKQQSLGLRLKKLFMSEDVEEEYFALHYRTDFKFKNYMLMVEIDEKGHVDRG